MMSAQSCPFWSRQRIRRDEVASRSGGSWIRTLPLADDLVPLGG
jgi:hypothetical protein